MKATYVVIFEETERNYCAYLPDFPGCITTGQTWGEVQAMVREAVEFHIEGMIQHGDSLPETPMSLEAAKAYHNRPLTDEDLAFMGDFAGSSSALSTTFGTVEVEISVCAAAATA